MIERWQHRFGVRAMCVELGVSRSGFYAWCSRPESSRRRLDRRLRLEIRAFYRASRCRYGSPRLLRDLREAGFRVSRKRVARLMQEDGIAGRRRRRFCSTTNSEHDLPVASNVLDRSFTVESVDTVWAGDITYIATLEGWLYLAVLLDLCSRYAVGWATAESLASELTLTALDRALAVRRPRVGLLHHSDRGSQYAADDYQRELARRGIVPSMSRRGNCWDNAPVESFFSTLKTEAVPNGGFATKQEARAALFDWIEVVYNRSRRHSSLGYLSPAVYEKRLAERVA